MKTFFWRNRKIFQTLAFYQGFLWSLALVVCLVRGNLTTPNFGGTLALLGMLLIGYAMLSVYGAWGSTRSFQYQYSASASQSIKERWEDNQRDMRESFSFLANSMISGLLAAVFGVALFFF